MSIVKLEFLLLIIALFFLIPRVFLRLNTQEQYQIPFRDAESGFEKHEDVAYPFVDFVKEYFNQIDNE